MARRPRIYNSKAKTAHSLPEIGSIGLNTNSGMVYEEFIPKLRWPRAGKIYKEMSDNDPVVGAILFVAKQLIRNVSWSVHAASEDMEDVRAAAFVAQCMEDMSSSWNDTIAEILSMLAYGWSWHEIVYKKREGYNRDPRRNSKYSDGLIGWRKLPVRSQDTLWGWKFDPHDGSVIGMIQHVGTTGQVIIPIEKSILFRTETVRGNPEGKSLLRNAYRPWYFKKHIEEIEGIGIERDLAGLPVLIPPESIDLWNEEDPDMKRIRTYAETLVQGVRRDQNEGILLPHGWELKLLSTQSGRQFDTNAIINRYDQRIAITLLADIVMLGADKVGSFALAKVKRSLLGTALDAITSSIAEVFNRYAIPRLIRLNPFNVTDYPKLKASQIEAPDLNEIGNYIQKLSGARMPLFPDTELENHLRQIAQLPARPEDFSPYSPAKTGSPDNTGGEKNKGKEEDD